MHNLEQRYKARKLGKLSKGFQTIEFNVNIASESLHLLLQRDTSLYARKRQVNLRIRAKSLLSEVNSHKLSRKLHLLSLAHISIAKNEKYNRYLMAHQELILIKFYLV